ncbi:hypothetical protein Tco_1123809 [Tanacetum coccineum]|uniref:Uncharacterized protein n=1 Tax=Tanacetum coccineum TaxID=301880 RepID=A0ABQ5J888_9ASTR
MSVHNSEHNTPNNSDHDDDIHDSVSRISKLDISDPLHLHPNDTTALTCDRVNAIVLGWILNSISDELFLGKEADGQLLEGGEYVLSKAMIQ